MGLAAGPIMGGLSMLGDTWNAHENRRAQERANAQNIQNSREQRQWEEVMSNTAVRRRADDIEAAGGNRALAFTNGQEASTPTYTPARVEPEKADYNFTGKAMMAMQMAQANAQTKLTTAQARSANVEADIREQIRDQEKEFRANRFVEGVDWDDLKTDILRNSKATTGLQVKQLEQSVDNLIRIAKNQADKGSLDIAQIKSVIESFGLGAQEKTDLISKIMRMIYAIMSAKD